MKEIAIQADGLSVRWTVPRAVDLPCRGILSDAGIGGGVVDAPRGLSVAIEPAPAPKARGYAIRDTFADITNREHGKYPAARGEMVDELERSLAFACEVWGESATWEEVDELAWTKLYRRRCELLIQKGCLAVRATEITVQRLTTAVGWLRDKKRIHREAAQWPRKYKKDIADFWKLVTGSEQDPEPRRLRYTLDEFQRILAKSDFDPRLKLLLRVTVGLRPGQVARARRSDLKLPVVDWTAPPKRNAQGRDITDYGKMRVHGAGKKKGGVVALTPGQRRAIDSALADVGYLAGVEAEYQAKTRVNYVLFPSGYTAGRVGMMREKETTLRLGRVDWSRHITSSWTRKNWRQAEARAGVEHIDGRGPYGQRRLTVDVGVAEGASPSGIQAIGLWTDAQMPLNVYAEGENSVGQIEARPIRALMLGEERDLLEQRANNV